MSETIEVVLRDKNKPLGNSADENFNCRAELTNLKKELNEVKNDVNGLATKFNQLEKNIGDRLEKQTAEIVNILRLHLPIGGPGPNNAPQLPVPVTAHDNLSISEENLTIVYETRIIRREKFTNMDEYLQMSRNERPHSQIICTTSDFKVLLNGSNVIADKSTFLMEWFRRNESSLFALPKGVGKSCLLSMAKQFFSISANNFDSEADPFTENDFQFKIMEEEFRAFRECNKNKWPVIFVRFTTVIGSHFDDISCEFQAAICKAFKEHEYLIQWLEFGMQKKREAEKFKKYFYEDVSLIEAIRGIPFLATHLQAYYNKKVLVIVDDYDKALEEIACNNYSEDEEIRKIYKMIQNFLTGVISENDTIERVLIAGGQQIVLEDVIAYGMSPSLFTKYFGFTMDEFDLLCNYFSLDNQQDLVEAAKSYYNGYVYEGNIPLYSTHSCVKFFRQFQEGGANRFSIQATPPKHNIQDQQQKPLMKKYRLTSFFEEYGYTLYLSKLFQHDDIAKLIRTLANGEDINSPELRKKFTFEDFIRIRNMVAKPEIEVDEDGKKLFWQFLYSSGFIVEVPKKLGQKEINAKAPNEQMRDLLANKLKIFYTAKYRFSYEDINPVTDELFEIFTGTDCYTGSRINDKVLVMPCPKLEKALSKLLSKLSIFEGKKGFQYIPSQDAAHVRGNEHIIHFITDMAAIRMPGWLDFGADYRMNIVPYDWIKKEKKSKEATSSKRQPETRPDISVKNDQVGMVIELKYEDEEEEGDDKNKKKQAKSKKPAIEKHLTALKQIGENCYLQIFWKDKICTKIIALGISVNTSKQVTVGAVIREIDDKKEDIKQFVERVSKELYFIDNPKPK